MSCSSSAGQQPESKEKIQIQAKKTWFIRQIRLLLT